MFEKKKLYKIRYKLIATYATIIEARNEGQALKRLKRELRDTGIIPDIINIERYTT